MLNKYNYDIIKVLFTELEHFQRNKSFVYVTFSLDNM